MNQLTRHIHSPLCKAFVSIDALYISKKFKVRDKFLLIAARCHMRLSYHALLSLLRSVDIN